jgi:hypothetical protein
MFQGSGYLRVQNFGQEIVRDQFVEVNEDGNILFKDSDLSVLSLVIEITSSLCMYSSIPHHSAYK